MNGTLTDTMTLSSDRIGGQAHLLFTDPFYDVANAIVGNWSLTTL
jgi:hypothetical protein